MEIPIDQSFAESMATKRDKSRKQPYCCAVSKRHVFEEADGHEVSGPTKMSRTGDEVATQMRL